MLRENSPIRPNASDLCSSELMTNISIVFKSLLNFVFIKPPFGCEGVTFFLAQLTDFTAFAFLKVQSYRDQGEIISVSLL